MATWEAFGSAAPEVARKGLEMLEIPVAYLATRRRDGSPRIHPVCPHLAGGRMYVVVGAGSPKRFDLSNDGRFALHAFPPPLPPEDPAFDEFEFNLEGRARRVPNSEAATWAAVRVVCPYEFPDEDWLFELDIARALTTWWDPIGSPGRRPHRQIWHEGWGSPRVPSNEPKA